MASVSIKPAFIEHVNITVSDPDRAADMLEALFDWKERWRGPSNMGGWTIHVGTEHHYLALYTKGEGHGRSLGHAKGAPLNHVGIQVDDLAEVERRVVALGLTPFSHSDVPPGRRFYFFCPDGIEYEILSYRS